MIKSYGKLDSAGPSPLSDPSEVPEYFEGFAQHVDDEFVNIEEAIQHLSLLTPQAAEREPPVLLRGTQRFALAPWDPIGDGTTGWVYYDGEEWTTYNREAIALLTTEVSANASAITGLTASVIDLDGVVTALASDVTSLDASVTDLETGVTGNATAITGLETRVTSAEGNITAISSDITTLESEVTGLAGDVSGNASAINSLGTRVTTAEGNISANSSSVTSLSSTVATKTRTFRQSATPTATAVGDLWIDTANNNQIKRWSGSAWVNSEDTRVATNASAISSLNTEVSSIDGELSALSTSFTGVFTNTGGGDAAALFRMNAVSAPAGYSSSIRLEARASTGDAWDAAKATMIMDAATAGTSRIRFVADRIVMAASTSPTATIVPFATFTGAKITFSTDVEINGNLLVNGSVQTGSVATDAITEMSSAYTAGTVTLTTTDTVRQTLAVVVGANQKVLLFTNAIYQLETDGTGPGGTTFFEITRNGVAITDSLSVGHFPNSGTAGGWRGPMPWMIEDTPGTGTFTYRLVVRRDAQSGLTGTVSNRSMVAMLAKR